MKILVLTSSYPRFDGDGSAPFVKSICENLADLGHDITVVAPYDPVVNLKANNKVKVYRFKYIIPPKYHIMGHGRSLEGDVKLKPIAYLLILPYLLSSLISSIFISIRIKPDLIHVHWVLPNGPIAWFLSKLIGIPYVVSLHGSDIYISNKNRLFQTIAKLVFTSAALVTACSPTLMKSAQILGADGKVVLLPWGADPKIFTPVLRNSNYRKSKGYPEKAMILLALGRMVYKKGFDILLDIWPVIIKEYKDVFLIIGGDGPIKNALNKKIHDENIHHVIIPGKIPWNDVPSLLANSNIFILPSIRDQYGNEDGLPTVLLEAMASGLPVVASAIGGIPLVVNHLHNGILVEPGDNMQLLEAVRLLLNDPQRLEELAKNAREDVVHIYNWRNVASEFNNLFISILRIPSKNG